MIRLENVTKRYGSETVAVRDASFDVAKGDFVFLVGPSGSGKTTLLGLICGVLNPSIWQFTDFRARFTDLINKQA